MGFMDKAKEAALKAQASAQQAAAQGQAKLAAYQAQQGAPGGVGTGTAAGGSDLERAYAALGRAFYAEQRQGGAREAVVAALAAVDAAVAVPGAPTWDTPVTPTPGAVPGGPVGAPPPPGAVQAGNFTLDDL